MDSGLAKKVWAALGGPADVAERLELPGPRTVFPSAFDVTGLAVTSVAAASLAIAEVASTPGNRPTVKVDSRDACAAFVAERRFTPIGWELPPAWDPISGDYATADGWIRLHTNYAYHRQAVLDVLGLPAGADRAAVAAAVRERDGEALEQAVVDADGCAAVLRSRDEWLAHPAGMAAAGLPLVDIRRSRHATDFVPSPRLRLAGLRVVDITRVIAGPIATRFLAGYGADVLRIDPPGFDEVGALLPITTEGKRCAALDISTDAGRSQLFSLLADAHVLVHGLRPGALDSLGLGHDMLAERFPSLVIGRISAYGTRGPWGRRHGFDSLVQMSSGIAATETARAGTEAPASLPAQALDHGTGYLLAAGVVRLLAERRAGTVTTALAATAHLLSDNPSPSPHLSGEPAHTPLTTRSTAWGRAMSTPLPGKIDGLTPDLRIPAGPLGRYEPNWR